MKSKSSAGEGAAGGGRARAERPWCTRCGHGRMGPVVVPHTLDVGFDAPIVVRVEARGCEACGRPAEPLVAARAARLAAIRLVAFSGRVNGRTLRFFRRAIGLQSKELAHLLGLGPGTISRWENGVRELDTNAWVVVASLALEYADGDDELRTMRILDSLRSVPAPVLEVVVRT